jgi:hypothetical protein
VTLREKARPVLFRFEIVSESLLKQIPTVGGALVS